MTVGRSVAPVRRRHVVYLSGFDPRGASHYHRLYRDEAAKQAPVGGYDIRVGARRNVGATGAVWAVDYRGAGGETVTTTVEFGRWDDVVRAHWVRHPAAVAACTVAATWTYLCSGALLRFLRWSWPAFVAVFTPFVVVVVLGAGALAGLVLAGLAMRDGAGVAPLGALAAWLALLAGAGLWLDRRWQMSWLMRSYHFTTKQARGRAGDLEARLDALAARLVAIVDGEAGDDVDEVLVVGHSSGTMVAISVVARALALRPGAAWHKLSLLTLGHCVPILSFLPPARAFRAELARVATALDGRWVDVTAPPDGCCFALVDPTTGAADDGGARPPSPKLLSARFVTLFEPEVYRAIRRDKQRCHAQYLMAAPRAGDYDYFAITAGPLRLAERFAAQRSVTGFRQFQRFGTPR